MKKFLYYKYFNEKILPKIAEYEEYRLNILKKVILSSVFMFFAGIIFAYIFIFISLKLSNALLLLPFMLFGMYFFFIKSIIGIIWEGRRYQEWLIENVLPLFYEPLANFKNWPKNNDPESLLNSCLFSNYDMQEDKASIFGIYKDTNVIISNTSLILPVKHNVFKGTVIQLELSKSIDNHIIFISKNERKYNKFKQFNPRIDELNKFLYVFAKNNTKINFITNSFWNIIKKMGEYFGAKGFKMSYNDNVIIIAMEQKRPWIFGSLFKSLQKFESYNDILSKFEVVFDLIDYLESMQLC